jgi:CO/xanthine dehydrogenase Mo-binding subunit
VRVRSRAWATNTVPYGAFRGFGAPQAIFAMERHMDEIAAAIGIDPIELRRRNFLHDGRHHATEQVMREPVILDQLLDRALPRAISRQARASLRARIRPIRSSAAWASPRFITAPDLPAPASVSEFAGGRRCDAGGKVRVLVSNTEFGQGTNTILTQIAAEALGIDYERRDHGPARHRHRSQQRPHCCFAHVDGRRPFD